LGKIFFFYNFKKRTSLFPTISRKTSGGPNTTDNNGNIQIRPEEQEGEPKGPGLPRQDNSDPINLGDTDDQGYAGSGAIWPYVLVAVALIGIVIVLMQSRKGTP
jgi:hypothetical protein